jgi:hypothetical protein
MREKITTAMTPEDQLCLLLARQLSADVRKQAIDLLASPLRWPLVLENAKRYGITPLLYHALEALGFYDVPDPVRTELANFFKVNAIRNELLAEEMARILRLLGDAGIPAMPLKGIALAESLYEDPALRVFEDMDILVPAERMIEAFHLLVSSGYKPEFTQPFLLDLLVRYGKDCLLMREDAMCTYPLELHCGLVWGGTLERDLLEKIWSEANRETIYGVPAFELSPDWEFLYLATHAARHGQDSLKWFIDLDRFCSRGPLEWASIKQKAQRLGWEDAVRESLSASAQLLGTSVDPAFAPATPQRQSRLLHPAGQEVPGGMLFSLLLLKTPAQKLRFLAIRFLIPTPADTGFLALPSSLTFLYYFLRPFRFAALTTWWLVQALAVRSGLLSNKSGRNNNGN